MSQQQPLTIEQIQLQAFCNWCRNPLVMSDSFAEANFVDIGRKWHDEDSDNAQAVYCQMCIGDTFRTSQPKSVIDRTTLEECDVSQLPDLGVGTLQTQTETQPQPQNETVSITDKVVAEKGTSGAV
jgi:hypothetical protein